MTDITLRQTKGAPLTHDELDQNFANLKETADLAFEASASLGGKANASAIGTDDAATDMGTTPGTILSDNGTAKQWFQESEAAIEDRVVAVDLLSTTALKGSGLVGLSQTASYDEDSAGFSLQQRGIAITDYPFSAPTDGTSSCVAALNAIAALTAGDLNIFLPAGTWTIDAAVTFADRNVTIRGAGVGLTRLRFVNTSAAVKFLDTGTGSVAKKLNVCDLTLFKDYAASALDGSVGIEAQWSYTGIIASWEHAVFQNVTAQANGSTKYWDTAIRLIDAGVVRAINCRLDNAGAQASGSRAFFELERRNATNTCSFRFLACFAFGTTAGVRITHASAPAGTVEGVYLTDCEFPGCRYGIYDDNEGTGDTTRTINDVKWMAGHANISRALMMFGYITNLFVDDGNFTFGNLMDSSPALEAAVVIRTYAESILVGNGRFVRGAGAATGKPLVLLPTRDSCKSIRILGNSIGGWGSVVVQVGTATKDRNRILVANTIHENIPLSGTSSGYELNGPQIVAQSAVAASITGTTSETTLATISILGGTIGPNGRLRITTLWSFTNSANSKTFRVKLGGTQVWSRSESANLSARHSLEMANRNSQLAQVTSVGSSGGGFGPVGVAVTTTAVDTSATQSLTITAQLANSGETIALESYLVELLYGE